MIFNIKLDDGFTWKAIFVVYSHKFYTPPSITCAYIISRYIVRIVLMLAALNGLNVKCADVKNPYINANPKERNWSRSGKNFGVHKGKVVVVVRLLYVLESGVSALSLSARKLIRDLVFAPYIADGCLWMKKADDTSNLGATTKYGLPAV